MVRNAQARVAGQLSCRQDLKGDRESGNVLVKEIDRATVKDLVSVSGLEQVRDRASEIVLLVLRRMRDRSTPLRDTPTRTR